MTTTLKLHERAVVLVGAGQTSGETIGNGRATALSFAREGAKLLLADIDGESLKSTREILRDEGYDAEIEVVNVLKNADCQQLIERAQTHFGRIDILHYSAGKGFVGPDVSRESEEEWDLIMDVNLRGFFLMAQQVLPLMREQRFGVIQGISSAAAVASGGALSYKASKAGMNALVQSLAVSNGPYGIRVNAIMPGLLDTPMVVEYQAERRGVDREVIRAERDKLVPLNNKMGTAWDVANAAVFLASDAASYISGAILPVDGAFTARVGV